MATGMGGPPCFKRRVLGTVYGSDTSKPGRRRRESRDSRYGYGMQHLWTAEQAKKDPLSCRYLTHDICCSNSKGRHICRTSVHPPGEIVDLALSDLCLGLANRAVLYLRYCSADGGWHQRRPLRTMRFCGSYVVKGNDCSKAIRAVIAWTVHAVTVVTEVV